MNSPTPSSITTSGVGSGSAHFDLDFNESILQVHKRSPLYIIGDRAQHRVNFTRSPSDLTKRFSAISDGPIGTISKLLFSAIGIARCESNQSEFQEVNARLRAEHCQSTCTSERNRCAARSFSIEFDVILQIDRRIAMALSAAKDPHDQLLHRSIQ